MYNRETGEFIELDEEIVLAYPNDWDWHKESLGIGFPDQITYMVNSEWSGVDSQRYDWGIVSLGDDGIYRAYCIVGDSDDEKYAEGEYVRLEDAMEEVEENIWREARW